MKKKILHIFAPLILLAGVTQSCCLFFGECDECDAYYLSDLALTAFNALDQENSAYYAIGFDISNTLADVSDCENNVDTADPNDFNQRLFYSPNESTPPIEITDFNQTARLQSLEPGQTASVQRQVQFLQNGLYTFVSIVDLNDEVDERNENNNNNENAYKGKNPNEFRNTIRITNTGNPPPSNPQSVSKFVNVTPITITYK